MRYIWLWFLDECLWSIKIFACLSLIIFIFQIMVRILFLIYLLILGGLFSPKFEFICFFDRLNCQLVSRCIYSSWLTCLFLCSFNTNSESISSLSRGIIIFKGLIFDLNPIKLVHWFRCCRRINLVTIKFNQLRHLLLRYLIWTIFASLVASLRKGFHFILALGKAIRRRDKSVTFREISHAHIINAVWSCCLNRVNRVHINSIVSLWTFSVFIIFLGTFSDNFWLERLQILTTA